MTQPREVSAAWGAFVPPARREHALVQAPMDGELLVYDEERHRAHAVNGPAAQVLQRCDGQQSVEGVARQLVQARNLRAAQLPHRLKVEQALVWLALLALGRAHLLKERLKPAGTLKLPTRRDLLRQLGQTAVALPAVASIMAPSAMDAVSCSLLSCATKPCCITKLCSGPPTYLCV